MQHLIEVKGVVIIIQPISDRNNFVLLSFQKFTFTSLLVLSW